MFGLFNLFGFCEVIAMKFAITCDYHDYLAKLFAMFFTNHEVIMVIMSDVELHLRDSKVGLSKSESQLRPGLLALVLTLALT